MKSFGKKLAKERERNEAEWKHLCNREFACEADAQKAAAAVAATLPHQWLTWEVTVKDYYPGKGRPKQGVQPGQNRLVRCTTVVRV